MLKIRNATYHDAPFIKGLLAVLGYQTKLSLLVDHLERLFGGENDQVYVCDINREVVGFVTVHYMPQLAFAGGIAIISNLSAEESVNGTDVAAALEKHVMEQARIKSCEQIQVQCIDWQTPAHQFYLNHGYQEFPKYFTKRLVQG
ncbi:MAG TPA: GNAT family N-acetyltransferase [Mucilaginibacter sp.]|jgi:N-acetylglutamate synthase-like GNAT family acetyltransferase|nr:GNAT family N-acetyltransferase [Mucilaginibacter sp.]